MATLGKTSDGASSSASSANKTAVSKVTAGATGTVTAGHFRAWLSATGSTTCNVVIYADSSGNPGALLATSDNATLSITSEAQTDVTFSGANQITVTNGVDYHVGLSWQDPGTPSLNLSRDNTASGRNESAAYLPDPFGSPTALTGPIDVYVDVTTTSTITATMAAPLGSLSGSMAVTVSHLDPVFAAPLGGLTGAMTATVTHDVVMAAPLGGLTGSMTAGPPAPVGAVLAAPLGSLTGAMAATVTHTAVLAAPLGALSGSMTAGHVTLATLAAPLGGLTGAMAASAVTLPGVPYLTGDLGDLARLTIEIAFGADLTDLDGSGWSWTDVTTDVRADPGLLWRLGRGDELSTSNPAELKLVLTNTSGDYSLGGRSPHYPYVRRNTPVRVTIDPDDGGGDRTGYLGFATGFTPGWDALTGEIPVVTLTASGTLRRLDQGAEPVISPIRRYLANLDDVVAYWPCEVGEHATYLPNEFGGVDATWAGTADLASCTDFSASNPLPTTNASGLYRFRVDPYTVAASNTQSVRMMFVLPETASAPADGSRLVSIIPTGGTITRMDLVYGTGSVLSFKAFDETETEIINDSATFSIDGDPGMLSLEFAQSGATMFMAVKFLGLGATNYGTSGGDSGTATFGTVKEVWVDAYQTVDGVGFGHLAVMTTGSATDPLTDGVKQINAYDGEVITSGRLQRICDENSIDLTLYGGSSSAVTYNDLAGPQPIASVLDILHACEDVERGLLWDGLTPGLAYTTRRRHESAAVGLTIDASAGELAPPFEPVDDDQRTRNRWVVSRRDGAEFGVEDTTGPMGTDVIGNYADSLTLNCYTDLGARYAADWLVHAGTVEGYRYPTVTIDLRAAPQLAGDVLDLFPGARVDITNLDDTLVSGPGETVSLTVEGIEHNIGPRHWIVTLACSLFAVWRVGVFAEESGDTGEFVERLETDGSTLNADYSAGVTSIAVATASGPLWTTDSDDYPLDLDVGGVRVTASACSGSSSPQTFTVTALPVARSSGDVVKVWQPPVLGL